MKAPDKIYYDKLYVNPSGYEEGRAYELNPDPLPCVEYIRKEAVLEWAKEIEEKYVENGYGERGFYELLDKIESL